MKSLRSLFMASVAATILASTLFVANTHAKPQRGERRAGTSSAFSGVAKSSYANINKGNWLVGGSISLSQSWLANNIEIFSFGIVAPVQYFVVDRLALGGVFSLSHSSGDIIGATNVGFGPAATWYFWDSGKWASYVSQAFTFQIFENFDDEIDWASTLGLNYFITPSVAFGPGLRFTHTFGLDDSQDSNNLNIFGAFQIHL